MAEFRQDGAGVAPSGDEPTGELPIAPRFVRGRHMRQVEETEPASVAAHAQAPSTPPAAPVARVPEPVSEQEPASAPVGPASSAVPAAPHVHATLGPEETPSGLDAAPASAPLPEAPVIPESEPAPQPAKTPLVKPSPGMPVLSAVPDPSDATAGLLRERLSPPEERRESPLVGWVKANPCEAILIVLAAVSLVMALLSLPDLLGFAVPAAYLVELLVSLALRGSLQHGSDKTLRTVSEALGSVGPAVARGRGSASFAAGIDRTTDYVIWFMMLFAPAAFVINWLTKGDLPHSLLFAGGVALFLTPELLPVLERRFLSEGALSLAKERVALRRLDATEDLAAVDILCIDTNGTLTKDKTVFKSAFDVEGKVSGEALRLAYANSCCKAASRRLTDVATIEAFLAHEWGSLASADPDSTLAVQGRGRVDSRGVADVTRFGRLAEIPYGPRHPRSTVYLHDGFDARFLVVQGGIEEVLPLCTRVKVGGRPVDLTDEHREAIQAANYRLGSAGLRVVGVASAFDPVTSIHITPADERDLTFVGYLTFADEDKEQATNEVSRLVSLGITPKVITGDTERVARAACRKVGLDATGAIVASDLDRLGDEDLARRAERVSIFARLSPGQKARVVRVLQSQGHIVAYLGDGNSDAEAMQASDCSLSAESAADGARSLADVLLLDKDLGLLAQAVVTARECFGRMTKAAKITAQLYLATVAAVVLAMVFLPILPMAGVEVVFLSVVFDVCCATLANDPMDSGYTDVPRRWDFRGMKRFMAFFGGIMAAFDVLAFVVLYSGVAPAVAGATFSSISSAQQHDLFIRCFQMGWCVMVLWMQGLSLMELRSGGALEGGAAACRGLFVATLSFAVVVTAVCLALLVVFAGVLAAVWAAAGVALVAALYAVALRYAKRVYSERYGELL
jgi:Mg2+-importing ATPase